MTGDSTPPSPAIVWGHISTDKPLEDLTDILPPDLYQWAVDTWQDFVLRYIDVETVVGEMFQQIIEATGPEPEREVFTAAVAQRPEVMRRYLMLLFNGDDKGLAAAIWQALKPAE